MTSPDLPTAVKRFIALHIPTVEQLEVLLLLRGAPDTEWDPGTVSAELYTQPQSAMRRLDDLTARGFLVNNGNSYRYAPVSTKLAAQVEELADAYARRRVRVITQIFSSPDEAVANFSAAFRIKKSRW